MDVRAEVEAWLRERHGHDNVRATAEHLVTWEAAYVAGQVDALEDISGLVWERLDMWGAPQDARELEQQILNRAAAIRKGTE